MIIECDARRDDVNEGEAMMHQPGFDQRHQLLLVAGEAPGDEAGAELQRHADQVDGLV